MNWKAIAIALTIILLVENIGFYWMISTGIEILNNEAECSVICINHGSGVSYYYDSIDKVCYCYEGEEVVHAEIIGER